MPRPRGFVLNPDSFAALLESAGRTQAEVAETAGISTAFLSSLLNPPTARAIEKGKKQQAASPSVAAAIAGAMRVPVGALFPEATRIFVYADPEVPELAGAA